MAFPIENKLVIAIASSALFDLTESDAILNHKVKINTDSIRIRILTDLLLQESLSHSLNVCCH